MADVLSGKRFLLTGASSGIGKALAKRLIDAGVQLAVVGRSEEKLRKVFDELKPKAMIVGDVAVEADRRRIVDAAVRELGGLDGLVNNAGIASWGHFAGSNESIMRQILEVNFFGPVELMRLCIPHLTKENEPVICNVASMTGRKAMPAWPEYSASKHALCGLTEALRGEMARFGIEMVLVIPGLTKSDLQKQMLRCEGKADLDFNKGMEPDYVAERIVRAIRRRTDEVVIGSDAKWMLRMNRFLPRLTDRLIANKVRKIYANKV